MSPGCNDVSGKALQPCRQRRTHIPAKPNYSLNLWSIMKNCIGKELSKIPMPVSVWGEVDLFGVMLTVYVKCISLFFIFHSGKLQWAPFDATASYWGSGVSRASGQGGALWLLPGADVPGRCLLRFVLLHHCSPDCKALQPPVGWNLRTWSTRGVWIPLAVWTGNDTEMSV